MSEPYQQGSKDVELFDQNYTFQKSSNYPGAQPENHNSMESEMESEEFQRGFAADAKAKAQQDDQAQLGLVRRVKKEIEEMREDFENKIKHVDKQMKKLREEWKNDFADLDNRVGRNQKAQVKSLEDLKKETKDSLRAVNHSLSRLV